MWEGIDLEIREPGLVGILGPNGVGKSTLMHMLNRIQKPTEGRVRIGGTDVSEIDCRSLAKIVAYVPQQSNETFSMTVMDTVLMGRYPISGFNPSREDLRVAARCLSRMGLADLAMRSFNELSAGQHQKVMIARGLAQEPQILMLDEPTSNLDVYHQIHVMGMLRDVARERGMIVLVICHDLNVASRFCDRIVLMCEGAIRADGPAERVITAENIRDVYGVRADVIQVDGRPYAVYRAEEDRGPGGDASDPL